MNNKISNLLVKINEKLDKQGDNIFIKNEKTNDNEIKYFEKWIEKYYKNGFYEYIDFAKTINGLEYNGLILYSLNKNRKTNIYDLNEELWYDTERYWDYIIFGEDNISWYCLNRFNGKYYIMKKYTGINYLTEYKTFDEIIIRALNGLLNIIE